MLKKYRHKESGEVVEASRQHNSIWFICFNDGLVKFLETKFFKQQYEPIE